jgi:multidrug efflux pump subunit AcrA (membrane-fusion protein)
MLTKLFSFARSFEWRSRRGKQTIALSAALIVVLLIIGRSLGGDAQTEEYSKKRFVDISRVEDLMGGGRSLIIVGNVESINEAAVRSETGGKVVRVRASLGDRVSAGQTLAELENSSQRAALLQAEGALEAAQAALTKIKEGTRSEQLRIGKGRGSLFAPLRLRKRQQRG